MVDIELFGKEFEWSIFILSVSPPRFHCWHWCRWIQEPSRARRVSIALAAWVPAVP